MQDRNAKQAAITIQKYMRGFFAKKNYKINHLSSEQQTSYLTFVVGNDPLMPKSLNNYHNNDGKIALIATSGMRAVSLACKLGNINNTPKIILLDNSSKVYKFWHAMREFINNSAYAATAELFVQSLPLFLNQHKHLFRDFAADQFLKYQTSNVQYLNQNINNYFKGLINKYSYAYMKAVILHTSLIKQSWADVDVFVKIKNILNHNAINQIFMYPSNIIDCVQDQNIKEQILNNIIKVNPQLTIHTHTCDTHKHPEQVLLIKNNDPKNVMAIISKQYPCLSKTEISYDNLDDKFVKFMMNMLQNNNGCKSNFNTKSM